MKSFAILLISIFFTTNLLAQTELKGARSWKTVSSLIGKSITEARSDLKKYGLSDLDNMKDESSGMHLYKFYPVNTKEKEYEAEYLVGFRNEKVIYLAVQYEYKEEIFKDDINDTKNNLTENGFIFDEQKKIEDYLTITYKSGKKNSAMVMIDRDLANFRLIIGETKYVKMAME